MSVFSINSFVISVWVIPVEKTAISAELVSFFLFFHIWIVYGNGWCRVTNVKNKTKSVLYIYVSSVG